MRVDVISDFVCPWCYVGKRRLERVLERNGDLQPVVNWRAFQLNSGIPPGGVDRALYLARKFGYRIKEIPIQWRHFEPSRVRLFRDSLSMFGTLLRMRFRNLLS